MCLYIHGGEVNILTAKEDITVYKIIRRNNTSAYKDFQYKPNTLYRLRRPLETELKEYFSTIGMVVNKGFHSYCNYKDVMSEQTYYLNGKIVEFVIPKGAKYIKGIHGGRDNYVSTSIRSKSLRAVKKKA